MTEARYRPSIKGSKALLCRAELSEGRLCNSLAIKGREYCKHHGGKLPLGPDSALFKTGLWSAQRRRFAGVAPKLLTRIDELRDDPELFSLRDDAAYITALMDARAEAAGEGVSLDHYNAIKSQYSLCKSMMHDPDSFESAFKDLGKMISSGVSEYEASKDVVDLIAKRADIIETEQKIMQAKAYTLEVDQAYSLIMQVLGVIKANVRDPSEMSAISDGFGKLLKTYQDAEIIDAEVSDVV
jgi:hypothetical protein